MSEKRAPWTFERFSRRPPNYASRRAAFCRQILTLRPPSFYFSPSERLCIRSPPFQRRKSAESGFAAQTKSFRAAGKIFVPVGNLSISFYNRRIGSDAYDIYKPLRRKRSGRSER